MEGISWTSTTPVTDPHSPEREQAGSGRGAAGGGEPFEHGGAAPGGWAGGGPNGEPRGGPGGGPGPRFE